MRIDREYLCMMLGLVKFGRNQTGRWEGVRLPCRDNEIPGEWTVILKSRDAVVRGPNDRQNRQRLFVVCQCGREIPIGRIGQHKKACTHA